MKTEVIRYNKDGSAEYEQGIIICSCNDFDHSIIYWKNEWPTHSVPEVMDKCVYLGVSLHHHNNFWERLKLAWGYLWKKEKYGSMYGEIIIDQDNVSGLEDIVNFIKESDINE